MEHHEFIVATLFYEYIVYPLGHLFGYDLEKYHLELEFPHVAMVILISAGLIVAALLLRRRLSVDNPGNIQQAVEVVIDGILTLMKDMIGSRYRTFFPIIGALFFYILVSNILGLIPGFMSPTSNINVTAGCAIIVFLYYNYHGFKTHGFRKYMAHFAGPSLAIAPLLFVIEIISHLARPLSLSVRLFGNIFAEELIVTSLNSLFPFIISLPVMALALFASTIQAFIFIVLTMVYIGGAVEMHDDHDDHDDHHEEAHAESHPVAEGT